MIGLFQVNYFDPNPLNLNMASARVTAYNAEQAIKKAERFKPLKKYRVESVECLGFSDEE